MIYIKTKDKKRILLLAGASCIIIAAYPYKHIYHPSYEILGDDAKPFAKYSLGYVYIGDEEYLDSLKNLNDTDVLVLDERRSEKPNMSVYHSCNIKNKDIRNEILEIMCYYESIDPSDWNRTIESMRLEWFCHNMGYYLNYQTNRTEQVDLDNKDEEKYNSEFVRRMLRL